MLHWDFTCMELYEWKLRKRFSLFDRLRRDMVAAHGRLPSSVPRFPLKVRSFVSMDRNAMCLARCAQLEKFVAGLLAWQPESRVLAAFLEIRGGRVDEMANIGRKKKKKSSEKSPGQPRREMHHAQSVMGGRGSHRRYLTPPILASPTHANGGIVDAASAHGSTRRGKSNSALGREISTGRRPDIRQRPRPDADAASAHDNDDGDAERAHRPSDVVLAAAGVAQLLEANKAEDTSGHVVVTLGGPLNPDVTPRLWLKERIEAGVASYMRKVKEGASPVFMVVTGGDCAGLGTAEAEVMRRLMVNSMGVPKQRILAECQAKDTIQNALLVVPLLIRLGIARVTIVTSEFHVRRTKHYFGTILKAYRCKFQVEYVACQDHMSLSDRSVRDRKETLLVARSQGLLDKSVASLSVDAKSHSYGRHSWSFSVG